MREDLASEISNATTLQDVLLILKKVTMLDTHVATLAYLEENIKPFNGRYGIWTCRPFPLDTDQEVYQIQAYYFSKEGDSYSKNTMAVIVFMDRNFINSLNSVNYEPKQTRDLGLHSIKYAVLMSLPGLELSPEEEEEIMDF